MPSVAELTALYGNFMLAPRRGPSVCEICFNFTDGYRRCYACTHNELWLDAVLPISYSVGLEQLHYALRSYKRGNGEAARRHQTELAAVLWRFIDRHERCIATHVGARAFDLVTAVPSSDRDRDQEHPLHQIVGSLAAPTRDRHQRLLLRTDAPCATHEFSRERYAATKELNGASILLIDDTWTTGASAQSAAAALKQSGAQRVAAIVVGRHLNRQWGDNDQRLRRIPHPYDWENCALCARSD